MSSLPQNSTFSEKPVIKDFLALRMTPQLVFIKEIPFTKTESQNIVGYRELYTVDQDPGTIGISQGMEIESDVGEATQTYGNGIALNTRPRKAQATFLKSDMKKPNFKISERKKYNQVAWAIGQQVDSDLTTLMKAAASSSTTRYDAANGGTWNLGTADPLNDLRLIAEDMSTYQGYKMTAAYVHRTNFNELFGHLEGSDIDLTYARELTEPRDFDGMTITLKNPRITVYGVREGLGITEGSVLALGTFQNEPCVWNYAYSDPDFGSIQSIGVTDEGDTIPDLPLNVNTWWTPNGYEYHVEAWLETVGFVEKPAGVFYKSTGI